MRLILPLAIILPALSLSCKKRTFGDNKTASVNNAGSARAIIDAEASRFGNAQFAMFDNHNETYFTLKDLYRDGKLAKNSKRTLIHFDYHSDLYRNDSHLENNINIGNYINTMVWKQDVSEVWWIVPDETRSTKPLSKEWGCASIKSQNELYWGRPNTFRDWQFRDGPGDQLICVDQEGRFDFKPGSAACPSGTKTVKFIKRTLGDLLAANNIAIKGPSILDIDADFFDMSGNYANESPDSPGANIGGTPRCYSLHYDEQRLDEELKRFAIAITKNLDLRPDYIAVARSPGYTVQNTGKIFGFLAYLGTKAKAGGEGGGDHNSDECTAENADARIIADDEIKVRLPSGGSSTAKPFEPVCFKKMENSEALVHFPLPPAGDAYVDAQFVKLCNIAKLNACINGGGGPNPCAKRECTKAP